MESEGKLRNLSEILYHQHPTISRGPLMTILRKTPAEAKHLKEHGIPETPAMKFGSMVHIRLLEPHLYDHKTKLCSAGQRRTKVFQAMELDHSGTLIRDLPESDRIERIFEQFSLNPVCQEIMGKSIAVEGVAFWRDEKTGLECRARPDIVTEDNTIWDLKTARDISTEAILKKLKGDGIYEYLFQAAFYLQGVAAVMGKEEHEFDWGWIFAETNEPYRIRIVQPRPEDIADSHEEVREALDRWKDCVDRNEWPGYSRGVEMLPLIGKG